MTVPEGANEPGYIAGPQPPMTLTGVSLAMGAMNACSNLANLDPLVVAPLLRDPDALP
ncbi:MAG: hypothetical protein M3Y56_02990 [Armatimonadota bacterium]|nr:hypothetical protein [Armatimonadota bacterium]